VAGVVPETFPLALIVNHACPLMAQVMGLAVLAGRPVTAVLMRVLTGAVVREGQVKVNAA